MKIALLVPLTFWLVCGCAPDAAGPRSAPAMPRAGGLPPARTAAVDKASLPNATVASYEVSVASAEADRVRAREQCESKAKAERRACNEAADAAYDLAKSAAETGAEAAP